LLSLLGRDPTVAQKFMASLAREVMSLRTRLEVLNIRSASERILRGFPEDRRAGPARSDAARSSPDHDLQQEILDHTVTADGISGNLADVHIQI